MKNFGYETNYSKEKLLESPYYIYTEEQENGVLAIHIQKVNHSNFIDK